MGTEQHSWPGTQPLRFHLLSWCQDSLPTLGQARPGLLFIPKWAGSQLGRQGCVQSRQGLANEALESGHSSQGQSWGERRPWMESVSGVARQQAKPKQLTGRAEPTMKVERASRGQRHALSDGSHARLWVPATAELARFDNPKLGLNWLHHGLCVPLPGPAMSQTYWSRVRQFRSQDEPAWPPSRHSDHSLTRTDDLGFLPTPRSQIPGIQLPEALSLPHCPDAPASTLQCTRRIP